MALDPEPENRTSRSLPVKHNKTLEKSTGGTEKDKAEVETQVERLAIKLRNTAEPATLLDKILDRTVLKVTVREIISCSEGVRKLMFGNIRNYGTKLEA